MKVVQNCTYLHNKTFVYSKKVSEEFTPYMIKSMWAIIEFIHIRSSKIQEHKQLHPLFLIHMIFHLGSWVQLWDERGLA